MFGPTFDMIFLVICGILSVVFFLGKGDGVLRAFTSRELRDRKSGRTAEEERKYQFAIGIFLLVLALCSLMMFLVPSQITAIIELVVVIGGMIILLVKIKKKFPQ